MQAKDIDAYLRQVGTWVDWERSCDRFYAGDPSTEVTGIAVCWWTALGVLKQAQAAGCNLFVMHEPLYDGEPDPEQRVGPDDAWVVKQRWLDQTGMVIYRCHDVWDDFPEVGIHGAWAKWLGFDGKPVASQKWYEVHDVSGRTVRELARQIAARTAELGQDCVHFIGDLDRPASRIALGTGAITNYRIMHAMGADVRRGEMGAASARLGMGRGPGWSGSYRPLGRRTSGRCGTPNCKSSTGGRKRRPASVTQTAGGHAEARSHYNDRPPRLRGTPVSGLHAGRSQRWRPRKSPHHPPRESEQGRRDRGVPTRHSEPAWYHRSFGICGSGSARQVLHDATREAAGLGVRRAM